MYGKGSCRKWPQTRSPRQIKAGPGYIFANMHDTLHNESTKRTVQTPRAKTAPYRIYPPIKSPNQKQNTDAKRTTDHQIPPDKFYKAPAKIYSKRPGVKHEHPYIHKHHEQTHQPLFGKRFWRSHPFGIGSFFREKKNETTIAKTNPKATKHQLHEHLKP